MVDEAPNDTPAAPSAGQEATSAVPLDLTGLALEALPPDVCLRLAQAFSRQGQTEAAHQALGSACRSVNKSVTLADQCAEVALELGLPALAADLLEARLNRRESMMAFRLLARAYLALADDAAVERLCQYIQQAHSDRSTTWDTLGDVALARGDLEGARAAYAHLLKLAPQSISGQLGMARYYARLGDEEAARRASAAIFAAYGDHPSPWILRSTREIAQQLGDNDWLAELDARLAKLAAKEDQLLTTQLQLIRHSQDRQDETEQTPPERRAGSRRRITSPPGGEAPEEEAISELPAPAPEEREAETPPELLEALRDHFGYESFRPGQGQVIQAVLRGEDILALMPTGAGKSLCYQLPAMLLPGATVLISPLIALMKDQVDNLPEAIRAHTAFINSELDAAEQERRLHDLAEGRLKLVYVAPERLRQPPFIHALRRAKVSLLVIDEAHCISQWGHDFRPDYLFIPKALRAMAGQHEDGTSPAPPVLALTATATPAMREEIASALGRRLRVITTGVFRPNLHYEVMQLASKEAKLRTLVDLCTQMAGTGIVYARSRETCEKLATLLRQHGIQAAHYHAGMSTSERTRTQDAWVRGHIRIVVATVAFGLGINKADVRFIIHYNLPGSLEAYCQESGRAGRDGRPARCVLFYSGGDHSRLNQWLHEETIDLPFLRLIYAEARRQMGGNLGLVSATELEQRLSALTRNKDEDGSSETAARVGISLLERGGLLARHFDVPRTVSVTWPGLNGHQPPAEFNTFLGTADLSPRQMKTIELLSLAQRLGLSPDALEERLLSWSDAGLLDYRGGPRQMLLELLPAPPDATARLQALLDALQEQREAQIARLAEYAHSHLCRHQIIARHFGEALPRPCGVCDCCALATKTGVPIKPSLRHRTGQPSAETIEQTILSCLISLQCSVGKTGLARTLTGSIAAHPACKRSAYYGRLATISASRLEKIIDGLIGAGYLAYARKETYRVLVLTKAGQALIHS